MITGGIVGMISRLRLLYENMVCVSVHLLMINIQTYNDKFIYYNFLILYIEEPTFAVPYLLYIKYYN